MGTRSWFAAALVVGAVLAGAAQGSAQDAAQPAATAAGAGSTAPAAVFPAERLEQLVAPIALYPDAILSNVLMASTLPLEVIEASRWLAKNPTLKGAALEEALKAQTGTRA